MQTLKIVFLSSCLFLKPALDGFKEEAIKCSAFNSCYQSLFLFTRKKRMLKAFKYRPEVSVIVLFFVIDNHYHIGPERKHIDRPLLECSEAGMCLLLFLLLLLHSHSCWSAQDNSPSQIIDVLNLNSSNEILKRSPEASGDVVVTLPAVSQQLYLSGRANTAPFPVWGLMKLRSCVLVSRTSVAPPSAHSSPTPLQQAMWPMQECSDMLVFV